MESTGNAKYICPVHVGALNNGGVLTKFTEFSPSLYPDSITAIVPEKTSQETSTPAPKAKATKAAKAAKVASVEASEDVEAEAEEPAGEAEDDEGEADGFGDSGGAMIACHGCGEDMSPQEVPGKLCLLEAVTIYKLIYMHFCMYRSRIACVYFIS